MIEIRSKCERLKYIIYDVYRFIERNIQGKGTKKIEVTAVASVSETGTEERKEEVAGIQIKCNQKTMLTS